MEEGITVWKGHGRPDWNYQQMRGKHLILLHKGVRSA